MAGYGISCERCRFCGFYLPPDLASVMTHFNSHWRQCNVENITNLSPCAYEPQLDVRIGHTHLNQEDLEVSAHLEQTFQYAPQTEPSNLSVTGTRCSPLNLTGRPKVESPVTSLTSSLPNETQQQPQVLDMNAHSQHNGLQTVGMHSTMNESPVYSNYNPGIFNNCGAPVCSQIMPSVQLNETIDTSCSLSKKKRSFPRGELRCTDCNRIFFTKSSFDEHFNIFHSKSDNTHQNSYLLNNEPIDLNHCVEDMIPCTYKPYKCSICDREFMYKEELAEHSNNHEASKPYRCDLCGTGLSHISALRRHILSHSGHKPHVCEICNRGFFQRCDLIRHYSTHGRKKESQCNHCKKKYTSEYFLKNHKCKPPEEPKPFKCNICGNSCSTYVAWSYHMWKHTKNPAFVPFQSKPGTSSSIHLTPQHIEKTVIETMGV